MKKEIRLIGIDDAPFDKFSKGRVMVVGTIFRGGTWLDGILSTRVNIDGDDSTKKITGMINKSKFKSQLKAIFLDGIAVGGFNIIDIQKLNKETNIPVIVAIRKMPDIVKIKKILIKLGKQRKIKLIEKAGKVHCINSIYIQVAGIKIESAKQMLEISCTRSLLPEPIRAAHIIASGITYGESRGKA